MRSTVQFFMVFAVVAITASLALGADSERLRITVGKQRVLLRPQAPVEYFPDEPVSVLSEKPLVALMSCAGVTYRFMGKDWASLVPQGDVLKPSGQDTFDQGYAGICATQRIGNTLYALYHGENYLNKQPGKSALRGQKSCMMSIGLAISDDEGKSFRKVGEVLTSSKPYDQDNDSCGVGDVTMCRDRDGNFLLGYYTDFARSQGRNVQLCHARSAVADKAMPGTWFKYHDGKYQEPGLAGKESYVLCLNEAGADAWSPHVVYSKLLDRYLLTFGVTVHSETDGYTTYKPVESGFYISTSRDGITWSVPSLAVADAVLFIKGHAGIQHPTLHIVGGTKNAVKGMIVYGYTPLWDKTPHHLAGREITLRLESDEKPPKYKGPFGPRMRLAHRLCGTRWINTNNATFEWMPDGRLLHNKNERPWRVLDGSRVEITFDPTKKATLTFDEDLSHFDQPLGDGKQFEGRRTDTPRQ